MRYLKLTFYDLCRNSFGEDLVNFIFKNWRRFLDDCETLLEENEINPNDLISVWNSINQSIQFAVEYSKDVISFLGFLIIQNNDKIWINIYYKSTDTHRCLSFSSNHLNHCKKDIHFALARHICTIVEDTEVKMKHLEKLTINLSKFKYSKQLIECGSKKALSILLQELCTPKTIWNDKSLQFITTYNPNNPNFYETIEQLVECLKWSNVDSFESLWVIKRTRLILKRY